MGYIQVLLTIMNYSSYKFVMFRMTVFGWIFITLKNKRKILIFFKKIYTENIWNRKLFVNIQKKRFKTKKKIEKIIN